MEYSSKSVVFDNRIYDECVYYEKYQNKIIEDLCRRIKEAYLNEGEEAGSLLRSNFLMTIEGLRDDLDELIEHILEHTNSKGEHCYE